MTEHPAEYDAPDWARSQPGCMQRTGCHDYQHGTDCPLYDWARP